MEDPLSVITPVLLRQIHQARILRARTQLITGKEIVLVFFSDDPGFTDAIRAAWPPLKAISEAYGLDKFPDMMSFLPNPKVLGFPDQAFGMHVLVGKGFIALEARPLDRHWL
ncbi:hypothetical protein VP1G_00809 [Cytospora mali]|uniref:Uncharacterized protein n=1 Tax=Cytospora mali TaxID=578113 RepID=A0A194UNT6_CYTMA|nr:hypothetical protein VP1G_00809 [Valsa mali var. pyri (nom. inval.)]